MKCKCGSLMDRYEIGWVCFECDELDRLHTPGEQRIFNKYGERFTAMREAKVPRRKIEKSLHLDVFKWDLLVSMGEKVGQV